METKDYQKEILLKLVNKYDERQIKGTNTNRRISIKPSAVYNKYGEKGKTEINKLVNSSIDNLKSLGFIGVDKVRFGYDVKSVYLNIDSVHQIKQYLYDHYRILPRDMHMDNLSKIIHMYESLGILTDYYCNQLKIINSQKVNEINIEYETDILEVLNFIQSNQDSYYVREVSMLVFGTSKKFEELYLEKVCTIIREAINKPLSEYETNDEILKDYNIEKVDQSIPLKGDIEITINNHTLNTNWFSNGISLSSSDISNIQSIKVNTENFITIENKTSFYRFSNNTFSALYLGGYASRFQIQFLKLLSEMNKSINLYHFGDIDIGGFFIHQHLCNSTGIEFKLYKMGIEELKDEKNKSCLLELTQNDINRAQSLLSDDRYQEIIEYMLENNVKLEQEVISILC